MPSRPRHPRLLAALLLAVLGAWPLPAGAAQAEREIRQYEGQELSPFQRDYDNSIKGPQKVDPAAYRLKVGGLVERPLSLTYREILALSSVKRLANLPCVEGWSELLLFEGGRLTDILAKAGLKPGASAVLFHAVEGYSSGLDLEYIRKADVILAHRINGLTLDARRGFPLQVVAPHKLGYKWVKWVTAIEVLPEPQPGYWESGGYSDQADTTR